eukprot:5370396-Prymnesium_polylepis.1
MKRERLRPQYASEISSRYVPTSSVGIKILFNSLFRRLRGFRSPPSRQYTLKRMDLAMRRWSRSSTRMSTLSPWPSSPAKYQ